MYVLSSKCIENIYPTSTTAHSIYITDTKNMS